MLRGINKQQVFEDDEDNETFLWCLGEVKKISGFELYAYCLMGNHVHLLLKVGNEPLAQIFRRLGARFVYWYNRKYGRCGNLFQDRFKSEPVEDEAYFVTVLTYIHQNPVKAGLCEKAGDYEWSSRRYLGEANPLLDEGALKAIVSVEAIKQRERLLIAEDILEPKYETRPYLTDRGIRRVIEEICGAGSVARFEEVARSVRQEVMKKLRQLGAGIRQIARLTGMSVGVVARLASA